MSRRQCTATSPGALSCAPTPPRCWLRTSFTSTAPELIREALGDRVLPFVPDPVHPAGPSARRVAALLADIDEPLDDLARAGMAATFSDALIDLAGLPARDRTGTDLRAVRLVRDYLAAHPREQVLASELEQIAGTDRYTIARHFRRAFGTSPDRYRIMRRLPPARAAIENGTPLAQAAADAGFSDQSHMTRQFTKAYGMTPARWAAAVRAGRRCSDAPSPGLADSVDSRKRTSPPAAACVQQFFGPMGVGFRPIEEALHILKANRHGYERTSDVIRRSLRLLDREA